MSKRDCTHCLFPFLHGSVNYFNMLMWCAYCGPECKWLTLWKHQLEGGTMLVHTDYTWCKKRCLVHKPCVMFLRDYFSWWPIQRYAKHVRYTEGIIHPKKKLIFINCHLLIINILNPYDFLSSIEHRRMFYMLVSFRAALFYVYKKILSNMVHQVT